MRARNNLSCLLDIRAATTQGDLPMTITRQTINRAFASVAGGVASLVLVACSSGQDSQPQAFRLEAWGNVSALWGSETGSGKLDLYNGHDQQTVTATAITLTVISTAPGGAKCSIADGAGKMLDTDSQQPASGTAGLAASTTAFCSAPITPDQAAPSSSTP